MRFKIYGGLTIKQIKALFLAEVTDYIVNVCNEKNPERITNYMDSQWPLVEQYLVSGRGLDARASDLTCAFGTRFHRISPQPAELEPDEDCEFCDGTGEADSGGIHPWGAQASIRCRCTYPDLQ